MRISDFCRIKLTSNDWFCKGYKLKVGFCFPFEYTYDCRFVFKSDGILPWSIETWKWELWLQAPFRLQSLLFIVLEYCLGKKLLKVNQYIKVWLHRITLMDLVSGVEFCPKFGRLYIFSVVKTVEMCELRCKTWFHCN